MTRLNVDDARCKALFASGLQRSDAPTADMVAEVIRRTVRRFGIRSCISPMAQEFGAPPDHVRPAAVNPCPRTTQHWVAATGPSRTEDLDPGVL